MITLFPQVKSLHHQLVSISEPRLVIFALLLFAPCSGCFVATVYQTSAPHYAADSCSTLRLLVASWHHLDAD